MKTLETIQIICKVFHVIAKILAILSFVWAGLCVTGIICCLIWHGIGIPVFVEEQWQNGDLIKAIGSLLYEFVFGVTNGILFIYAWLYLKHELEDGTPFTTSGARQVKSLGIKTIVMPLVATVISAVIIACFDLSYYEHLSNDATVILGVALILVSFILRHGAELREGIENDNSQK